MSSLSPELDLDCLQDNHFGTDIGKLWCDQDLEMDTIEKPDFVEPSAERLVDLMGRIPFESD